MHHPTHLPAPGTTSPHDNTVLARLAGTCQRRAHLRHCREHTGRRRAGVGIGRCPAKTGGHLRRCGPGDHWDTAR